MSEETSPIFVELTDEEGNSVEFEVLDSVDYQGVEYLIVLPLDEEAEEVEILEVVPGKDGNDSFMTVEDQEILNAVFAEFKERFQDIYNFEA
jgi:uncharacterized protein YrzB (UPF0473 family)